MCFIRNWFCLMPLICSCTCKEHGQLELICFPKVGCHFSKILVACAEHCGSCSDILDVVSVFGNVGVIYSRRYARIVAALSDEKEASSRQRLRFYMSPAPKIIQIKLVRFS